MDRRKRCWNCGFPGHEFWACQLPKNRENFSLQKQLYVENNPKARRRLNERARNHYSRHPELPLPDNYYIPPAIHYGNNQDEQGEEDWDAELEQTLPPPAGVNYLSTQPGNNRAVVQKEAGIATVLEGEGDAESSTDMMETESDDN